MGLKNKKKTDEYIDFIDNSPEAIEARALQEAANNCPEHLEVKALQDLANNCPEAIETKALKVAAKNTAEAIEDRATQAAADNIKTTPPPPKTIGQKVKGFFKKLWE